MMELFGWKKKDGWMDGRRKKKEEEEEEEGLSLYTHSTALCVTG
jgi:hypothetical protein